MNVPGSNLLGLALTVVTPQIVQFYEYAARAKNGRGIFVTAYHEARDVRGSFQPVSRASAMQMGLDVGNSYAMFYATQRFVTVGRNTSGDQFGFNGRRYQSHDQVDWNAQDGWNSILLCDIGKLEIDEAGSLDFSQPGNPLIVFV